MAGGKTEKATPKKKQDEQKKGNIFQSRDIASALSLIVFLIALRIMTGMIFGAIRNEMDYYLRLMGTQNRLVVEDAADIMRRVLLMTSLYVLPIVTVPLISGVVFAGVQTRFRFYGAQLKPKFSKLNPLSGFKKMFSGRTFVELLKSLVKVVVVTAVVYSEISSQINTIMRLNDFEPLSFLTFLAGCISSVMLSVGIASLGIGVLDYFYQWWEYERNIRMSKQEIKEEFKQTEGDPQIKSRIRETQRKMALMRMLHRISVADVVITNPTHFAVALKYDAKKSAAPLVIAKGQDYMALRIIEEAKKQKVQLVENVALARGLYSAVDIDQQIPEEFYVAVAEVLAYVYRLKKRN